VSAIVNPGWKALIWMAREVNDPPDDLGALRLSARLDGGIEIFCAMTGENEEDVRFQLKGWTR